MTLSESDHSKQFPDSGDPQSMDRTTADEAVNLEALVLKLAERVALLEDKENPPRSSSLFDASEGLVDHTDSARRFSRLEHGVSICSRDKRFSERLDLIESRIDDFEDKKNDSDDDDKYKLPESTFTLFITAHPISVPFAFAVFTTALSTLCLGLTLAESVSNGTQGNPLGIPGGVSNAVRAAQFLGAIVGVLMEDEVPQGLQLIANGLAHELILNGSKRVHYRVVTSSIFRLFVGYLFLSSLFINVVQNSDVLSIFYDVLALEFVENIDDTAYALAKKGFFGRKLLVATNQEYSLQSSEERKSSFIKNRHRGSILREHQNASMVGVMTSNNRPNRIARFIYFLNAAIILSGMAYMTVKQNQGAYRCNTLTVSFNEDIWENAMTHLDDGRVKEKLLIYSYFSGVYKESGKFGGYPRYVEQNKNTGTPFKTAIGAEIKYCQDISAWVFMHPNIKTSKNEDEENECSWLMRSPETFDYEFINVAGQSSFDVWVGEIKQGSGITVTCNECAQRSDCNYHGTCSNSVCVCDSDRFGDHCEFELPCTLLASEKAGQIVGSDSVVENWKHDKPIKLVEGSGGFKVNRVYNRPVYIQRNLSGEPYDLRKYDVRERVTSSPSASPSSFPTQSPTPYPTYSPSTSSPTLAPSFPRPAPVPAAVLQDNTTYSPTSQGGVPSFGIGHDVWYADDDFSIADDVLTREENVYEENVPDFADWDDFFEMPELHDLTVLMEKYSVIIAFMGSRYYGTMIPTDASFEELFPDDFHGFWSNSFSLQRTFIISATTYASSPVGIDFFEMRRRINSKINYNVEFSYGSYGVLIPMIDYVGAGFFHCLNNKALPKLHPSQSPSSSSVPASTSLYPTHAPSMSLPPSEPCYPIKVEILYDNFPFDNIWHITRLDDHSYVPVSETFFDRNGIEVGLQMELGSAKASACLQDGLYEFVIYDMACDGFSRKDSGYTLRYNDTVIAQGQNFSYNETTIFAMPFSETSSPSIVPTILST